MTALLIIVVSHNLNQISINFIDRRYYFEHENNHFIRIPLAALNSGNCPQFRKSDEALKNGQF